MKISLYLAMFWSLLGTSVWAGQEYCGQLAYLSVGDMEQRGYYLKTNDFTAQIARTENLSVFALLKKAMSYQQKQIGTCITGTLSGAPSGSIKPGLKSLAGITNVRNYQNGNLPDSKSVLKLDIRYEGVWNILPRTGEMNIYTDGSTGKIANVTIEIWEPVSRSLDDWSLETISIDELMSGKIVTLPKESGEPMVEIKALSDFNAFGGDLKLSFKTKAGTESQTLTVKRDSNTAKYSVWKTDVPVKKITIVTRGLTESSGYVDSYRLN